MMNKSPIVQVCIFGEEDVLTEKNFTVTYKAGKFFTASGTGVPASVRIPHTTRDFKMGNIFNVPVF
jgi:hypothetical protein